MKRIVSCLVVFLYLLSNAFAQKEEYAYPSFDKVKRKFFKTYEEQSGKNYDVAKKKDGIYIVEHNAEYPFDSVTSRLFWSRTTGSYLPLPYEKKSAESSNSYPSFLKQKSNYMFDKNLYYGYTGWYNDVISELENKTIVEASLAYSLARAYSAKANDILKDWKDTPSGAKVPSKLTQLEIDAGIKYAKKSIASYYTVYTLDSLYETIVGNIYDKYSNEHLSYYYILAIQNFPEYAKQFLADSLYTPTYLDCARNLLASCKDSCILFTAGDGDTYPLLYLQEKKGFKKTVRVVNTALLNGDSYFNYLEGTLGLFSKIKTKKYATDSLGYVIIKKEESEGAKLEFSALANDINLNKNQLAKSNKDDEYYTIRTNGIKCPAISVDFSKTSKSYLWKSDLYILDVLCSYGTKRAIYFSYGVSEDDLKFFMNNFVSEGLVYKYFNRTTTTALEEEKKSLNNVTSFLNKKFQFTTQKVPVEIHEENVIRIINMYRMYFAATASELYKAGRKAEATSVAAKALEYFPVEIYPSDTYLPDFARIYLGCGNLEKGEQLLEKSYTATMADFTAMEKLPYEKKLFQFRVNLYILNNLAAIASEFKKDKLAVKYAIEWEKYNKLYQTY